MEERIEKAREYYLAGKQFLQEEDFTSANKEFKKAQEFLASISTLRRTDTQVSSSPQNPNLHYNLAIEYIKRNEFKQAEKELKRVLELTPNDKDACYNLGILYENYLKDKKQAIYYYNRYIELAPQAEDAWRVKSWIKELTKMKDD